MRVFIGFDSNENEAAYVAQKSLRRATGGELEAEFLMLPKLVDQGLIWRTFDRRGGQSYDLTALPTETFSTDFKFTRFLTPIIAQGGFALFVDCDVVFLDDPRNMLPANHAHKAVYVVKHNPPEKLDQFKMVNQAQVPYYRKNWSSVMLFNCDHRSNRRLSLRDVNERPGRDLHSLYWLDDNEIGTLAPGWNWLVDVEPEPESLHIAHMTLGGPWLPGWKGGSFDERWIAHRDA